MRTKIFGHRGYPAKFPENSLEGFDYCMHHGAEGIEFDVHLTRDRVPVIMHDENIKRTTNGKGLIKDFSLAELDQFHLANGERIPRLKDLFQLTEESGYEGQLNLEMKTNKFDYPGLPEKIFALADQFKFKQEIIYSSFNLQTLIHAQKIRPEENYNFLTDKRIKDPAAFVKEHGFKGVHPKRLLDTDTPERIWTVDSPLRAKKIIEYGAAGFFTNKFEDMMDLRKRVANY